MAKQLVIVESGKAFWAEKSEADAIEKIMSAPKGGIMWAHGYKPTTGYKVSPTQTIKALTRVITSNVYKRKIEALRKLTLAEVTAVVKSDSTLAALSPEELVDIFETRKDMEISSMLNTLSGDRSGAHRSGHDTMYVNIAHGVKVNLEAEEELDADGHKVPELTDGYPTAKAIMISALFLDVTVTEKGERKNVKSGNPVLMSNAIKKVLSAPSMNIKMLSLKAGNFESIKMGGEEILPEDIAAVAA